jgi:uncharacterized protein
MSASQPPPTPTSLPAAANPAGAAPEAGSDPSMEDILASIRRILSEDEAPTGGAAPAASPAAQPPDEAAGDDVLVLDSAMMVPEPAPTETEAPRVAVTIPIAPVTETAREFTPPTLVAPEAAAAAASSVTSLLRTLTVERTTRVHSGGPTIEDLVREELRPLLKTWLDTNLPPMVERLVRTEIERVVGRVAP